MKALYLAYVNSFGDTVDFQTGQILSGDKLKKFKIYSYSECELIESQYHHPDCSCKYCLYGREALPASEY